MAGWTPKQTLVWVIGLLAMLECFGWAVATYYSWLLRTVGYFELLTSEQVSANTQFAVLISAMLVVNGAGALAFVLSSDSYGLPILTVVQGVDVVVTIAATLFRSTDPIGASLELSAAPALTLVLIAILWRAFPEHSRSY